MENGHHRHAVQHSDDGAVDARTEEVRMYEVGTALLNRNGQAMREKRGIRILRCDDERSDVFAAKPFRKPASIGNHYARVDTCALTVGRQRREDRFRSSRPPGVDDVQHFGVYASLAHGKPADSERQGKKILGSRRPRVNEMGHGSRTLSNMANNLLPTHFGGRLVR
jgi:hypothetical protein